MSVLKDPTIILDSHESKDTTGFYSLLEVGEWQGHSEFTWRVRQRRPK
jgi:hypothetical protein